MNKNINQPFLFLEKKKVFIINYDKEYLIYVTEIISSYFQFTDLIKT